MAHEPERRHGRSDDELRMQREARQREWDTQPHGHRDAASQPRDLLEARMAKAPKRPENLLPMPPVNLIDVSESDIARRPYELYVKRGGVHGYDLEDWLQAERELRSVAATAA